jgi:hypothetical protein
MRLFGRRAAMQAGIGAVAAAPAIARGAVESMEVASQRKALLGLAKSGVADGLSTGYGAPVAPDPVRAAFEAPLRAALEMAETSGRDKLAMRINGLDPDIECLKSIPLAHRMRMQVERDKVHVALITKLRKQLWG